MTKAELQAELDKLGVEYPKSATNKELEALLEEAKKDSSEETTEEEKTEETPEDTNPVEDEAPVVDGGKKKAPDSIDPEGKFVLKQFKDGSRMYNELGQAVSQVENDPKEVSKLSRQCARSNALANSRKVRTPAGHEEKN